ncbi:MAG TPA: FAD binding domain-containing protein [Syntrophomonadaceae bacterium]|jgi:CO/xanthine dehydrogenase FAD-binding subunit|nr:FAD binding domain-containing protein [Syntrophomonadaceae bacterium]
MMPFDFEYHHPLTIQEAVTTFARLDMSGKTPKYYGGGTELISMARMNNLSFGSVVDIKDVPECKVLQLDNENLTLGSALTLTQIHENNTFPLLSQSGARVADHTIQNKITLGGNLCGTIIYKETLLPLLLTDSELVLADPSGMRTVKIGDVYRERIELNPFEFIVQVKIPAKYLGVPYFHLKRTKQDKITYPLVTVCALQADNQIRLAFSGLCHFPFRSKEMEKVVNDKSMPMDARIDWAVNCIPTETLDDIEGSFSFRQFVVKIMLYDIINSLGAS